MSNQVSKSLDKFLGNSCVLFTDQVTVVIISGNTENSGRINKVS